MRCVLIGNYGVGNVGDEALREYFLERFPEIEWAVLSARPTSKEYPRLPTGVRSLLFTPWWKTFHIIRQSDAVVFGGGSLFTDVESWLACVVWGVHAAVAAYLRKPIYLAFQGVGPFRTKRGEWIAKWVVKRSVFVSVRDEESVARIEKFNLNKKVVLSADPIFISLQNKKSERIKNVITVVPRHNSDSFFFERLTAVISQVPAADLTLVSLQPDDAGEREVIRQLEIVVERPAAVVEIATLQQLADVVADSSLVITQRYHGAIAALCMGVPVEICSQKKSDKLWALQQAIANGNAGAEVARLRALAMDGEVALKRALIAPIP